MWWSSGTRRFVMTGVGRWRGRGGAVGLHGQRGKDTGKRVCPCHPAGMDARGGAGHYTDDSLAGTLGGMLHVKAHDLRVFDVRTRIPFRYGIATMRECPHVFVK